MRARESDWGKGIYAKRAINVPMHTIIAPITPLCTTGSAAERLEAAVDPVVVDEEVVDVVDVTDDVPDDATDDVSPLTELVSLLPLLDSASNPPVDEVTTLPLSIVTEPSLIMILPEKR